MKKRFELNQEDSWLAGVCSGLADYVDMDPMFIRILFLIMFFLGSSSIAFFYIVIAILAPTK